MDNEAELKAFEQHFAELGLEFDKYPPNKTGAIYIQCETSCLWRGWKAHAAASKQEVIEELLAVLRMVEKAYRCAVDFEGAGRNMTAVIANVREAITRAEQAKQKEEKKDA